MGIIEQKISDKVLGSLSPAFWELENESHQHNVAPRSETHFKLTVVSDLFEGKDRISRHRLVHDLLHEERELGVHALSLNLYTPVEWERRGGAALQSPLCRGGSKA